MAVYLFGLTNANISPELPHMTFGAATKPTTTQIDVWITMYAAEVVTRLEALGIATQAGISTTITASANEAQYYVIRNAIIQAVIARVVAANQEDENDVSEAAQARWLAFLSSLETMKWPQLGALSVDQSPRSSWDSDRSPFWTRDTGFN